MGAQTVAQVPEPFHPADGVLDVDPLGRFSLVAIFLALAQLPLPRLLLRYANMLTVIVLDNALVARVDSDLQAFEPGLLGGELGPELSIIVAPAHPALADEVDVAVGRGQDQGLDGVGFFLPLYGTGRPDCLLVVRVARPLGALLGGVDQDGAFVAEVGAELLDTLETALGRVA